MVLYCFRVKRSETVDAAQEQLTFGALDIGTGTELVVLQTIARVEILEHARARIATRPPMIGARP